MHGTTVRMLSLGTAVVVAAGCYRYVPASIDELEAGETVRTRITLAAAERLSAEVPLEGRLIEGDLVQRTVDALTLSVPAVAVPGSSAGGSLRQRILVRPADVVALDRREMDGRRTLLVGAVVASAIGYLTITQFRAPGQGTRQGEHPTPNELVVPLRIVLPIGF